MRPTGLAPQGLTDDDYDRLDELLSELDAPMALPEVEGLIAAVASAPTTMMPSVWHPLVLGDPVFDSAEQVQEVLDLLTGLWNQTLSDFEQGLAMPDLEDEFWVELWCSGYLRGARLDDAWRADNSAVAMLMPAAILSGEMNLIGEEDDKGETITDDTRQRELARGSLQENVAVLHEYWKQYRHKQVARDKSPARSHRKVGRNEKCPCGSGLKFKKCCGQPTND